MKWFLLRIALCSIAGSAVVAVAATDDRFDVSRVIDQPTAEAILEESVKAPAPRNVEGTDGYYSKCNYYSTSTKKRLVLRVYQAASGYDPQKELEALAETTGAMRAISGLGDKARISSGAQSGLPDQVVMLYVVKGTALVTIGIAGFDDENVATDKIKTVAQKIVAKL